MKKANFRFNPYPYRYIAQYDGAEWQERIEELPNMGAAQEAKLAEKDLEALINSRSNLDGLPLVNYTNQYGMGCFEGLKAYPQPNGANALFRIDANAKRFYNSMQGLMMPTFLPDSLVAAVLDILRKSAQLGYKPSYDAAWEQENFVSTRGIYVRPFTYSEAGIGVNISVQPSVIVVATEVGSYFDVMDCPGILVSEAARATPHGTGWIKCASNYVIPCLEKNKAKAKGYIESLFLDAREQRFVEECSSCNIFFVLKDGAVVTPELGDTILPGITRDSIITLLADRGIVVQERRVDIEEVFDSAVECFSTGTAVGVCHFGKLTYKGRDKMFGDGSVGELAKSLQLSLKRIQHGLEEDRHNWLTLI